MTKNPHRPDSGSSHSDPLAKADSTPSAGSSAGTGGDAPDTEKARHEPTAGLYGWITHTELASTDPAATKAWCSAVLGWSFMPSVPTPDGDYHLFSYSAQGGGGIRQVNPPEIPGSIPHVHVPDTRAAFASALDNGAEEMLPPTPVMEGVTIAIVG